MPHDQVVFVPEYRRKVFYGEKWYEIGQMLRKLCKWKGVNVLAAEACPDLWDFWMWKAVFMIYEQWSNIRYKYRSREFRCKGYYVDTVGKNTKKITNISNINWKKTLHQISWRWTYQTRLRVVSNKLLAPDQTKRPLGVASSMRAMSVKKEPYVLRVGLFL